MQALELHQALLSDRTAQEAFRMALRDAIRGGETVLDLGTGTGLHACFACQAGARRVYAVDQHGIIHVAKEICRANGFADRVIFFHGKAGELELPEPVDVIVAHHGLPGLLMLLPDARDRYLKQDGVVIPRRVELFCAPLEKAAFYDENVEFWRTNHYGLTFLPMRSLAANTVLECRIEPTELLGEPVRLAEWDFAHVKQTKRSESVETKITRPGVLHGVALWLVEWLTNETALSAALPTTLSARLWPNFFLPIHSPLRVEAGETVHIRVQTGVRAWPEFWCWDVAVRDGKNEERGRCVQSTLSSCFLGKDALRKQAPDYVPNLSGQAVALRFVLEACDGVRSLRSIEEEVAQRFPNLFPNHPKAAEFVAKVVHGNCV